MSASYQINLRQAIYSLSDALDYVGLDQVFHSKRVAFLTRELAQATGLPRSELDQLTEAAILHDCGVSSTRHHEQLINELDWLGSRQHCARGFRLLADCPILAHHAQLALHHHTHWNHMDEHGLPEAEALGANAIFLADRIDALTKQRKGRSVLSHSEEVRQVVSRNRGVLFAPALVDAFLGMSKHEALWLMMRNEHVKDHLREWAEGSVPVETDFRTLRGIATIFSSAVDAKSPYTAEHSRGVGRLSRYLAELFELPEHNAEMLEIAGMLHDLGKLHVPDEVLDKPGPLNAEEFLLIRHHSFDTYAILGRIAGFEQIARWAGDHHETVDGRGYPHGHSGDQLPLESRILAAADIFQALAQTRPYRPSMPPHEIVERLERMAQAGQLDRDVVAQISNNVGGCWQAATMHTR